MPCVTRSDASRAAGHEPAILVLTLPDNPTGTVAPAALVEAVCDVAREHGLLVVCDEIYRDLAYEPEALLSPATLLPESAFVTNGLSKSMALGGWRIGFCRLPDGPLGADAASALSGMASEVWSSLAAPMQHAAAYVLGGARRGPRARRPQPPPAPPRQRSRPTSRSPPPAPSAARPRAPSTSIPTSSRCAPRWRGAA